MLMLTELQLMGIMISSYGDVNVTVNGDFGLLSVQLALMTLLII